MSTKIQTISRGETSIYPSNRASSVEGAIVLYDGAFSASANLARILAHELAHQLYIDMGESERDEYRWGTNWYKSVGSDEKFHPRAEGFVQDDGRDSPGEDFADNVEYRLFEEKVLRKETPQALRWLNERFKDKLILKGGREK